jgi:DNA-binding IclR family transcriptional regulator
MTGTNSADRILAILNLFSEEQLEWTADELMRRLGYSRPTLYRYIRTLKESGLLTSVAGGGLTLGPRVVELDFLMRKSDPLVFRAQPYLERLSASYPCSALLVRWYGAKLLCVASECSTPNPLSSYPRGRPMPLARGAISRAIMAWLPRRQLEPLIEGSLADFGEIGLGQTAEQVVQAMRRIRREGVAVVHGEVTPGVVGVASAILADQGRPTAAICVTIADALASPERLYSIKGDIRNCAENLSQAERHEAKKPKEKLHQFT